MRDIWKDQVQNELELYEARKAAVTNITEQIRELESQMTSIRSPGADTACGRSGGGSKDDQYLNNITKREMLKKNLAETKKALRRLERGMDCLSEDEQDILTRFFVNREKEAAFDLAEALKIDRNTVYARRNAALRKLAYAMYGGA